MVTLPILPTTFSFISSILAADLITGLMHWAEDTWTRPGASPLLDRFVVNDNIEHHRRPGSIRAGSYWATNRVCIGLAFGAAAGAMLMGVHAWPVYLVLALVSHSNQVHKWAHSANPPALVRMLQKTGLFQSSKQHARHHTRPYATNFCALTNYLNPVLERVHFWRALEWFFRQLGATVYRAMPERGGY